MDENKTIIDITRHIAPVGDKEQVNPHVRSLHTNPIFKKLLVLYNKDTKGKFTIKDLFR